MSAPWQPFPWTAGTEGGPGCPHAGGLPVLWGCRGGSHNSRWGHSAHAFREKPTCWGCCCEVTAHQHAPLLALRESKARFPLKVLNCN